MRSTCPNKQYSLTFFSFAVSCESIPSACLFVSLFSLGPFFFNRIHRSHHGSPMSRRAVLLSFIIWKQSHTISDEKDSFPSLYESEVSLNTDPLMSSNFNLVLTSASAHTYVKLPVSAHLRNQNDCNHADDSNLRGIRPKIDPELPA